MYVKKLISIAIFSCNIAFISTPVPIMIPKGPQMIRKDKIQISLKFSFRFAVLSIDNVMYANKLVVINVTNNAGKSTLIKVLGFVFISIRINTNIKKDTKKPIGIKYSF